MREKGLEEERLIERGRMMEKGASLYAGYPAIFDVWIEVPGTPYEIFASLITPLGQVWRRIKSPGTSSPSSPTTDWKTVRLTVDGDQLSAPSMMIELLLEEFPSLRVHFDALAAELAAMLSDLSD